jgi:hypothetical protein
VIFLATPMLAMAHGSDRHHDGPKHYKSWVKDRHEHKDYRNDRREHRVDRLEYKLKKQRQAKKHYKRKVKQLRRELRHERRHFARDYYRPHAYRSSVVYGFPNLVFHIDW